MLLLLALSMLAQAGPAATPDAEEAEAAVIANCAAHKFETTVQTTVAGKPRSSKVKLCGKVGQTDADWLRTLKDAADKVAANPQMSIAVKEQIVAALKVEIAKVSPTAEAKPPAAPFSSTLADLPPPRAVVAPTNEIAEYSTLPPFPAPQPAPSANGQVAAPPALPAPRLTFRCLATNTLSAEGPCDLLERDTLLTVRADENLPGGTSLRFLRRGDNRGEIDLPALRSGQAQRFSLPAKLCSGVSGSRVQIEVVRSTGKSSQVVDTRGPFELRC
jgi:hypothetical protein